MDSVRAPLSRTPSSNMHQGSQPYPNMSPYSVSYPASQTQLPPIQSQQQPHQSNYMPQGYRPEQQRYPSASGPPPYSGSDSRYSMSNPQQSHPAPGSLPQPGQQYQPQHTYPPVTSVSQSYPQRIAPAPPRDSNPYNPGDGRGGWPAGDPSLNAGPDAKDQRTHVVGSQGRRGILPSAPGRPGVVANGQNGTAKNQIPAKDADGKFPCPNCNKTYLHAKHLKRHLLRRKLFLSL